MACITVPLKETIKERITAFPWVNWSEVGREEILKREIFENYIKTRKLSKKDEEFCEKIDWHPVDELPLKEEFIEELKKIKNEPSGKSMTIDEFNKWCNDL